MEKIKYIFRKKGWLALLLSAVIGIGLFSYVTVKKCQLYRALVKWKPTAGKGAV